MTEEQADEEARRLNADVGRAGTPNTYYVPREVAPGNWEVERVEEKPKGLLRTFFGELFTP